ncbi:MAG: hypothetical protein V2I97_02875 [Desulfococcaceae bacterium]|jgi:hypothetical protein|nr:hypothetical protein [Desulfococcaceae bacterium]
MQKRRDYYHMSLDQLFRERDKRAVMIFGDNPVSMPEFESEDDKYPEIIEILKQHIIRFLKYDDMITEEIALAKMQKAA